MKMKKVLKVGAIVAGVAAVGFAAYVGIKKLIDKDAMDDYCDDCNCEKDNCECCDKECTCEDHIDELIEAAVEAVEEEIVAEEAKAEPAENTVTE